MGFNSAFKGLNSHRTQRCMSLKTKMIFCNNRLQSHNNCYDTHCTVFFNICILTLLLHVYFSLLNTFPEDGRKIPKHAAGLPYSSMLLYLLYRNYSAVTENIVTCLTPRNMDNFKFL
jgi:hypothetical protein